MSELHDELDRFYLEFRQRLFTCALAVTRCPERAEDAIQDAFYRLYRLDHSPQHLKAYVFRAVRNAALNQLRSSSRPSAEAPGYIFHNGAIPHLSAGPHQSAGPREQAAGNEFTSRVAEALKTLPDKQRETIVHHLYAELTFREIAELQGRPLGTINSLYRRGILKLRKLLEE